MDYLIIYGGTSIDRIDPKDDEAKVGRIKKTLDDFWVFNIREKIWQPLFANSLDNPPPTEGSVMIPMINDRLAIMFGGQFGERLRNDLWTYNLNTNLWSRSYIADKSHKKPNFYYNCKRCRICSKCNIELDIPKIDLQGFIDFRDRSLCESCTPCKTEDKEQENMSNYHLLEPKDTYCGTCEKCEHFTD